MDDRFHARSGTEGVKGTGEMKAKVLVKFKDKKSGKIHKVGDIINVSKARFEEILTVGNLVEEYKDEAKKAE